MLGESMVQELGLAQHESHMEEWRELVTKIKRPRPEITIGLVGKYVDLHDAIRRLPSPCAMPAGFTM